MATMAAIKGLNSFLLVLSIAASSVQAENLFNSPQTYFGGTDHEDYMAWVNAENQGNAYQASVFFPSDTASPSSSSDGAAVHWSIDEDAQTIRMAVAVRATGWLGFGLSEAGGMQGSDMFLFEAKTPNQVIDAHVLQDISAGPIVDSCEGDWKLVASNVVVDATDGTTATSRTEQAGGAFLIVEVSRLLDTQDPQDRKIINDGGDIVPASRIIAAWGNSGEVSYHGNSRVRSAIRWYGLGQDDQVRFQEAMAEKADGYFEIGSKEYPIKPIDTEYVSICLSWSQVLAQGVPDQKVSIVGIEPYIGNAPYVHHFTVYGGKDDLEDMTCPEMDPLLKEMAYVWAPGEPAQILPDNVGGPVGPGGLKSFILDIHYDNFGEVEGVIDSSGVRFYYSLEAREHDYGIFQVGDPTGNLFGQQVGTVEGLAQEYTFDCPGSCTQQWTPDGPITVLREFLHMHRAGRSIRTEQVRGDEVVRTGQVDYFTFEQQGNQAIQQDTFEILPGDSFRTTCVFENSDTSTTSFGWSSQEEMCIGFFMYYPRIVPETKLGWFCAPNFLEGCSSPFVNRTVSEIPHQFGAIRTECPAAVKVDGSSSAVLSSLVFGTMLTMVTTLSLFAVVP